MKAKIYEILRREGECSGEALAGLLGVSRTAVWKHRNQLEEEGYPIESIPGKGYRLLPEGNSLRPLTLLEDRRAAGVPGPVYSFETLDSTNDFAKRQADRLEDGSLIIALEQSQGRGRLGRSWLSPRGGLWMSLFLRPTLSMEHLPMLTLLSAAALIRALEKNKVSPDLKWPNDLFLHGKKIAGILTETGGQMGHCDYVIIGIGVNLCRHDFGDLAHRATSIEEETGKLPQQRGLILDFLKAFYPLYEALHRGEDAEILEILRKRDLLLGRKIRLETVREKIEGIASGISEGGRLAMEVDGEIRLIHYGEITGIEGIYDGETT